MIFYGKRGILFLNTGLRQCKSDEPDRERKGKMLTTMNPVLIAAAVIPAIVLLIKINKADRLEKEPNRLILTLVIQGVISTLLASFGEQVGAVAVSLFFREDSLAFNFVFYFFVVGLAEEGFKYLLLKRKTWNSAEFNCQFDGVVYAVAVSLGFALWENIGYVAMYGIFNAVVRAVTAVPGHACFGVFMGAFYGMAKRYQQMGRQKQSKTFRKLAVAVPVFLHGCYDFIATDSGITWVFVVFVAALFYAASHMVKQLSKYDRYITTSDIYYGYRE